MRFEGISLFASYDEKFLGDSWFDPLMRYLDACEAIVHIHPGLHPSSRSLTLPWPGFMIEYPFDTTRAAVNLLFSGALERFAKIRFILSHAGGTLPYLAWRLSVAPMIDKRLQQRSREQIFAALKTFWYDNALASGVESMGTLSRIAAKERILFGSDWPFCNERCRGRGGQGFHRARLSRQRCGGNDRKRERGEVVSRTGVIKRFPGAAQHEVMRCRTGNFGNSEFVTIPDQRCITSLRSVLHRVRETSFTSFATPPAPAPA